MWWLLAQKRLGMNSHIIKTLLVTITLFLLAGAAWAQSRLPASPGPNKQLQSDQENVKPLPEGQRDIPLQDLREQPAGAPEDQAERSLKKQPPVKPKSTVSRRKKSGARKPTSGPGRDRSALKSEPDWWPSNPQPAPASFSSMELSLQQYLEQDSTPEEDEPEDEPEEKAGKKAEKKAGEKLEELENLPQELKDLLKSQVKPQDNKLDED
jgi:hypothetical protein